MNTKQRAIERFKKAARELHEPMPVIAAIKYVVIFERNGWRQEINVYKDAEITTRELKAEAIAIVKAEHGEGWAPVGYRTIKGGVN